MIDVLNKQISMLREAGKSDQAVPLSQRLWKLCEEEYGPDHPQTLTTENNLAVVLEESGQLQEAEEHYRHSLKKRLEVLGRDHEDTAMSYNSLGNVLYKLGRCDEAKEHTREAYQIRDWILGPSAQKTLVSMQNLLMMHLLSGEVEPARSLLVKGIPYMTETFGRDHPATQAWRESLMRLPPKSENR